MRAALEAASLPDAERLVARLKEKARATRSRELEALGWFAQGVHEAAQQRFGPAEQALLIAVNIGRDLFRGENEALGHIARFLGFVYAKLDRPEQASEMFLLARNVFLKTDPSRAPEVIRYAASCNIALKLPEHALAIVHQEIGAPGERSTLRTADSLDLLLVRARAFEEQRKPLQALKALARTTQLLSDDAHVRLTVVRAWIEVARVWNARKDRIAAAHALACARTVDGGGKGANVAEIARAARALGVEGDLTSGLVWRVQRAVGQAVAFASPLRGLHLQGGVAFRPFEAVAAEHLPDGRWAVRRDLKLATGTRRNVLKGVRRGAEFVVGEVVHLDDGVSEPVDRPVLKVTVTKLILGEKGPRFPTVIAGRRQPDNLERFTASVWMPGEAGRPPLDGDDVLQELLNESA